MEKSIKLKNAYVILNVWPSWRNIRCRSSAVVDRAVALCNWMDPCIGHPSMSHIRNSKSIGLRKWKIIWKSNGRQWRTPNSPENKTKKKRKNNQRSNSGWVAVQILLWHSAFTWGIQQIYTPKNTEIVQAKADNILLDRAGLVSGQVIWAGIGEIRHRIRINQARSNRFVCKHKPANIYGL